MMRRYLCASTLAPALWLHAAMAQVPQQIVPGIPEIGTPEFVYAGTSSSSGGSSTTTAYTGAWGTTDAMSTLLARSYGSDAVTAAEDEGINPDTLAAFGQIESHFQNVGNASSSAEGVWQITNGTWNEYAAKLGLSDADRSDPAVQAEVASAVISDYATSVSKATGTSATAAQTYGAYMFGTKAGSEIATESDSSTPLSRFVSASTLAANNMSGWTVGQYYATISNRMGNGASEQVISS